MTADLLRNEIEPQEVEQPDNPSPQDIGPDSSCCLPNSEPSGQESKIMEVTITVLGLDGIVAKYNPSKEKSKGLSKKRQSLTISNNDKPDKDEAPDETSSHHEPSLTTSTASIVASFAHTMSTGKTQFLTHVPSLPITLNSSNRPGDLFQHFVQWPTKPKDSKKNDGQTLSTLQFKRHFLREDVSNHNEPQCTIHSNSPNRFVPQSCPIHLSISRNGKLIVIGKANVIINGEEKGESSINVPITSNIRPKKMNNAVKKLRNKNKGTEIPMTKIKGDKFYFGVKDDAMLRVLVDVSEVNDKTGENSKEKNPENLKDNTSETTSECISSECGSECDDGDCDASESGSVEQDDWEVYILANSELRNLRQQLAKSENANKHLHMELATTRKASQEENEGLRTELDRSKTTSEETIQNIRQELNQARAEAEMLPIYEARINELMEELKTKDTEVQCLRDEITEIRQYYRTQVDALLWDNNVTSV